METMAENKIQENPLPDKSDATEKSKNVSPLPVSIQDKAIAPVPVPVPLVAPSPRFTIPSLTKTPPNELYRRLLPAVLFLLTFVTVMTMLLIYMDTVALGAQQFRLNMSRDYELARIPQDSPALVAYVRQLHLAPRAPKGPPPPPVYTDRVEVLDNLLGELYNGTFVEFLPKGGRDPTVAYLEAARGWRGVAVRAAPRDFLALRGAASALHACLSPTDHPREVTYADGGDGGEGGAAFSSRVLCLPLYTVLLAGRCARAQYALLAGAAVPAALARLPYHAVSLQVIEFRSADLEARNQTTRLLESKNYTVAAAFPDGVMYKLLED